MVLVDTNIVAYLLIDGGHSKAAQTLRRRDPDWRSEAIILIEFTNVLIRYMAARGMSLNMANDLCSKAEAMLAGKLARIAQAQALAIAARYRVTAHDARFLAVAQQIGHRLITEDAKLRAAAPELTQSLAQALARS